jgi:SAM-dependent methyltransferase
MASALGASLEASARDADDRCPVCSGETRVLCGPDELARQRALAQRFHERRLERVGPGEFEERADFTQDARSALLECAACGHLARARRPGASEQRRLYAEDAYPEARLPELHAAQTALFRRKIPVLRRVIGRPRRVLEVGSFVGGFLAVARQVGWDAVGVDPGGQLVDFCRARGLRVYRGTLAEFVAHVSRARVDCLAIWNTFDQLDDPHATLALAAQSLERGGVLALRVPHGSYYRDASRRGAAASRVTRGLWTASLAWNNLLSFPYLHGYGLASLDRLVTPFGFERVAAQGDVLVTLAGRATAAWARAEEQLVKRAQLARIRRDARSGSVAAAPWLDVYWRRI